MCLQALQHADKIYFKVPSNGIKNNSVILRKVTFSERFNEPFRISGGHLGLQCIVGRTVRYYFETSENMDFCAGKVNSDFPDTTSIRRKTKSFMNFCIKLEKTL